jgi:fatty-acyl-CoA synthase
VKWGERPLALVVRRADREVSAPVVREHLMKHVETNRISRYAVPEESRIVFVEEIPKTSVGKIDKKRLRQMAA